MPRLKNIIVTQIGDLLPPFKGMVMNFALKYIYKKIPALEYSACDSFQRSHCERVKVLHLILLPLTNQDIAFLQYTGGTTGISKGAILTHRNIIANIQQADAWFKSCY